MQRREETRDGSIRRLSNGVKPDSNNLLKNAEEMYKNSRKERKKQDERKKYAV